MNKVRELLPDQFVLVSILQYHEEDNKKVVEEVLPISYCIRTRCK